MTKRSLGSGSLGIGLAAVVRRMRERKARVKKVIILKDCV